MLFAVLRGISGRRLRLMAGLRRFECLRDSSSVGSRGMFLGSFRTMIRKYREKPSVSLVYFNSRRALQKVPKDKGLFFSRVGLLSTSDRISLSEMIRWSGSIVRRIQVSEIETATLKRRERDDSPVSSKDHVHCKLCVDRATPINL